MKFLKNEKTGQIMHWNKILAKKKGMLPCQGPEPLPEKEPDVYEPVDDVEPVDIPVKPEPVEPEEASPYLDKKEAAALIKQWFGRTVDKVTVGEFYEYAKAQTGEDFPEKMTKLAIVTKLAAELASRAAEEE